MCLAVYIASDRDLPLIPWNESNPSFYVGELSTDKEVVKQFMLPNVRYVGSDEGCGCGFSKDGEVGDDLKTVEKNYQQLATYVENLMASHGLVELFSCWEGDQTAQQEFIETIRVSDLTSHDFDFKEKAYYRIEGEPS